MATHVTAVPYSAVDKNNDGKLSRAEIEAAKKAVHDKAAHGSSHPPALAHSAHVVPYSAVDKNNDGKLSRAEIEAAKKAIHDKAAHGSSHPPALAHSAHVPYSAVDKNNDGKLSRAEIEAAKRAVHDKAAHGSSHPPALAHSAHVISFADAAHGSSHPPALAHSAHGAHQSAPAPVAAPHADARALLHDLNHEGSTLPVGSPRPDKVQRRCRDILCAEIFLLATVALVLALYYGYKKKELSVYGRQGTLFPEFLVDQGAMICGVSAQVKTRPYLYFCEANELHRLNYSSGICIKDCSHRSEILQNCTRDYPALPVAGRLCVPKDEHLRGDTFDEEVQKVVKRHPRYTWIMGLHSFLKTLDIIFVSALIAFLVGLIYSTIVAANVRTAACFASFGFFITAVAFGTLSYFTIRDGVQQRHDVIGAGFHAIAGALMGTVAVCALVGAAISPQVVNSAGPFLLSLSECVTHMGALTLEPALASIGRMLAGVVLVFGLSHVLSDAEVTIDAKTQEVTYRHKWQPLAIAAGEVVVMLWWLEFLKAVSLYVSSYVTQVWFSSDLNVATGRKQAHGYAPLCNALQSAWCSHLGTLTFGAAVLPWVCENWRCSRACRPSDPTRGIGHLHRDAYIAVAGYGSSFCGAARQVAREFKGPHMYGSTPKDVKRGIKSGKVYVPPAAAVDACVWVMSTSVLCLAASLASAAAFAMITFWSKYADPASADYVRDPLALLMVAMLVALAVVTPFVQVPEMVLHTILFCFEVDMEAKEEWKEDAVRWHPYQAEGAVDRSCSYLFASHGAERPLVVPEVEVRTMPPKTEDLQARILFNAREAGVELSSVSAEP